MEQFVDQKLLEAPAKANLPAFLTKLWKIVEDEQYHHLVSWNENGTTIKIHQPVSFAQEILPRFYKHNNFSSFVRQVNMYGFRKIVDVAGGNKHADGDWEFYHAHFQRDQPQNIAMMKRKGQLKEEMKLSSTQLGNLLQDVEKLKSQHDIVDEKLNLVKTENERLWREVFDLRERHSTQQAMIVKLIQFFLQLVMNKSDCNPRKRRSLRFPGDGKGNKKKTIQFSSSLTEVFGSDALNEIGMVAEAPSPDGEERLRELSGDVDPVKEVECAGQSNDFSHEPSTGPSISSSDFQKQESKAMPSSPFVFPEVYKQQSIIDLSSCISSDGTTPNPLPYSVKTTIPDSTTVVKKLQSAPTLSTPVVSMPSLLSRQTSFRDREEVSTNVDKISQSIEILQDMLNKQEINLDLKNVNLNSLYGDVPTNVSMQELFKLMSQQNDESQSEDSETTAMLTSSMFQTEDPHPEGQVIPYTDFSPNHLDSEFETVNVAAGHSDFFDSVLQEEDEDEDDIILVT